MAQSFRGRRLVQKSTYMYTYVYVSRTFQFMESLFFLVPAHIILPLFMRCQGFPCLQRLLGQDDDSHMLFTAGLEAPLKHQHIHDHTSPTNKKIQKLDLRPSIWRIHKSFVLDARGNKKHLAGPFQDRQFQNPDRLIDSFRNFTYDRQFWTKQMRKICVEALFCILDQSKMYKCRVGADITNEPYLVWCCPSFLLKCFWKYILPNCLRVWCSSAHIYLQEVKTEKQSKDALVKLIIYLFG